MAFATFHDQARILCPARLFLQGHRHLQGSHIDLSDHSYFSSHIDELSPWSNSRIHFPTVVTVTAHFILKGSAGVRVRTGALHFRLLIFFLRTDDLSDNSQKFSQFLKYTLKLSDDRPLFRALVYII